MTKFRVDLRIVGMVLMMLFSLGSIVGFLLAFGESSSHFERANRSLNRTLDEMEELP